MVGADEQEPTLLPTPSLTPDEFEDLTERLRRGGGPHGWTSAEAMDFARSITPRW
jgi:hypothetical protein